MQVFAVGLLAVMAAVVVVWPGSAAALVFIVGCGGVLSPAVGDGVSDRLGQLGRRIRTRCSGLPPRCFLVHAVDALREVLPGDVAIESAVLVRWVRRVAEALVPGLLLGGLARGRADRVDRRDVLARRGARVAARGRVAGARAAAAAVE